MDGIWLPIGTAPKDGTQFLCYQDGNISNAWWTGDVLGGRGWSYAKWAFPTHWMPLPKTPEQQAKIIRFDLTKPEQMNAALDVVMGAIFTKKAE